jgi:acetyltransferase-like isoleucine patch superfamily enzyme
MRFTEAFQRLCRRCALRTTLTMRLRRWHLQLRGARIGQNVSLARTTVTWPHQLEIGPRTVIEQDVYFKYDGPWKPGPSIIIGSDTFIGAASEFNIRASIRVGESCLIASGCKFIDHDHRIAPQGESLRDGGPEAPISLESNVWLGVNVVVLKGVNIGTGAIVGAGSVVTKSIPPNEIWAGVPAKQIGRRPRQSPDIES